MSNDNEEPAASITNGEYEPEVEYLSFSDLEAKYREKRAQEPEPPRCGKLIFRRGGEEITDLIGYNAAQPIYDVRYDPDSGKPYFVLAVRMERPDDETNSTIEYFRAATPFSEVWDLIDDEELPEINGQDPSITKIGGQLLLGVVEVKPVHNEGRSAPDLEWNMAFYKGPSIRDLEFFAKGPPGMKDVRSVEMPSGKIINFTRPQNPGNEALGGRGQIGEITTDTIEDIKNPDILQNAPFINTRFLPEEWGGINYAIALKDEMVGVIGHIARFDKDNPAYAGQDKKPKIYCPFSGIYNPVTRKIEDIEILAMADEIKDVIPKTPLVKDVDYATAITGPDEDGDVMLIRNIGDAASRYKMIKDPFAGLRLPDQNYRLAA